MAQLEDKVNELIYRILGEPSASAYQLCMRILSSRMQSDSTDLVAVSERIKKLLVQKSTDNDFATALKFQELYAKLVAQHPIIKQKGSLLSLLLSLSSLSNGSQPLSMHTGFSELHIVKTEREAPSIQREAPQGKMPLRNILQDLVPMELSEHEIIREILFSFQGIDSKYIYLDPATENYIIAPRMQLPRPMKDLILKLCEMGWLYRRISTYLRKNASNDSFGMLGQSFCYAIQIELAEYYRLIAILESQVEDEDTSSLIGNDTGLTVRRLVVWTQEPFERIKFMACIVDSVEGLRGGALASGVYAHQKHGDPFIRSFVERLMTHISAPLFVMIRQWVFEGVLSDAHHEFFVQNNPEVSLDKLWKAKYTLNESMVPEFINRELANKILVIGKSINFIRHCCDDTEWVLDSVATVVSNAQRLNFGDLHLLGDVIRQASDATNRYLIDVLHKKYNVLEHCRALKHYMLLGQGDFIQYLMYLLGPELSKPASQIYRHNLMNVLETAVNSSNAKFESTDVLQSLDVKLHQSSAGDDGWDVFSLHYKLISPLNTVIDEGAMSDYLKIFHFLWRLKRVEYSLSNSWRRDMNLIHVIQSSFPVLCRSLHRAYLLRNEMIHFTANLHNYMMFEVLESSWYQLLEGLKQSNDLDELIESHTKYLNQIKTNAFMGSENKEVLVHLKCIFDTIIKFTKIQDFVYTAAMREVHQVKMRERNIKESEAKGTWGVTDEDVQSDLKSCSHLVGQLESISKEYTSQFQELLGKLKKQRSSSEHLRFLTFRLDFNEYYAQTAIP